MTIMFGEGGWEKNLLEKVWQIGNDDIRDGIACDVCV